MELLQITMENQEETDALIMESDKEGPNKLQFHMEGVRIKISH